jgi:hypothetical protein
VRATALGDDVNDELRDGVRRGQVRCSTDSKEETRDENACNDHCNSSSNAHDRSRLRSRQQRAHEHAEQLLGPERELRHPGRPAPRPRAGSRHSNQRAVHPFEEGRYLGEFQLERRQLQIGLQRLGSMTRKNAPSSTRSST